MPEWIEFEINLGYEFVSHDTAKQLNCSFISDGIALKIEGSEFVVCPNESGEWLDRAARKVALRKIDVNQVRIVSIDYTLDQVGKSVFCDLLIFTEAELDKGSVLRDT